MKNGGPARVLVLVGGAMLVSCVSGQQREAALIPPMLPPSPEKQLAWARVDGQRMSESPELSAQARADLATCKADSPPRAVTGVRGEECMKEGGYYVRDLEQQNL